jgi:putative heme transporter
VCYGIIPLIVSYSTKRRWRYVLTVATFVALILLVYAARDQILNTLRDLRTVNIAALSTMILWQMLNYHGYGKLYQSLYRILGERIRYRPLVRVALELNFVNNVFPSGGVSGISYFALRMRDAKVSGSKSTVVQFAKFILLFISFQILMAAGLFMLALTGSVNNFTILVAGSLFTLLLVGTLVLGFIIGSKKRINNFFTYITKVINKVIYLFRRKSPEAINIEKARRLFDDLHENYLLLKSDYRALQQPVLYALVCNVAEILTIYAVYVAFGQYVNPGAVILAYAVASFSGVISVLPGGVGIYEATMTAILAAAGVPPGVSIPVTVMYRILNMLIQLPPGYILYHRAIREDTKS